jgi:DNA polymerase-3 subunit delta
VAELAPERIAKDPASLVEEALALAFGGGRRVVRVRDAGDALAPACALLLAEADVPALVVIEAGELPPRSALRRAFEESESAAALACYHDEGEALGRLIDALLSEHRVAAEPAARAYLVQALGGDRAATRTEIAKLADYLGEGARARVADVETVVGDSAAITLDQVAFAVAGGDAAGLDRALAHALAEGSEPVTILRAVARHLERVHLVAGRRETGLSVGAAMAGFRPPLHFRVAEAVSRHAASWSAARAARAMAALLETEVRVKTTGNPAETVCRQALLGLAAGASTRR